MELGVSTFVELTPDPATGKTISAHQRMMDLMEEIELAEQVGLDVFAIGEHHRPDLLFLPVVLAAVAVKLKAKLSSAVSVLSSDDPVRVFQQYATVDLLSAGRTELMVGRESFIESFPLLGMIYGIMMLFTEKLNCLKINESEKLHGVVNTVPL